MDENLNAALSSLDMLATVTNARREYLAERRFHNICSLSCVPPWRSSNSNGVPTKENQSVEKAFLYCAPRRQSDKFCNRRPRSRCLPYDIRRKPFHGFNSSTSGSTHFSCGSPHLTVHSAHLDELNKSKTEKFPVPVLFRSKSLEDLRDTSTNSSQGLQLQKNLKNFIDFGSRGVNRSTNNNINIKKEIDSMSMRIEKLDVA